MPVGSNSLFSSQGYLSLLGGLETVWRDFTGQGVTVAIYDTGVEASHPDLVANYDASRELTLVDGAPNSSSATAGHGTAIAGIIGAANNSIGGVGVAYDCTLVGIDYLGDAFSLPASGYVRVLQAMAQYEVVNCSWGVFPSYSDYNNIGSTGVQASFERDAIEYAAANGRGGLGTIMTKAAGNYANDSYMADLGLHGNAQGDGLNNLHEFIVVGATDAQGKVEDYSNWGVNLLIAAPSASVTTDMSATAGYTSSDYVTNFSGTSAATSVVSGVVALMLEANPDLNWRDVQSILASSAAQTGSAFGRDAGGFEADAWLANDAGTWNGGGMTYHVNYGYGMIDALAAVRMAEVWSLMRPDTGDAIVSRSAESSETNSAAIRDLSSASLSVTLDAPTMFIDHLYVDVEISHSWLQDVALVLITPGGTELPLMINDLPNFDSHWTFGVSALQGMTDAGTWTVRATDNASGDTGILHGISLQFTGQAYSPDDIYTFTDDFLSLVAQDSSRAELADTDAGEDWLNIAALSGNVHLSMRGTTSYLKVNQADWATISGGIEHVVAGDGQDTLSGSAADNLFYGGRGHDILIGAGGQDTLDGGAGDDSLEGEEGDDSLEGNHGNDTLSGGTGRDHLYGGSGHDLLYAGGDDDQVQAGTGDDDVRGGGGNDSITGDIGMDTLYGDAGNDVVNGGNNSDVLYGGSGDDRLVGESGFDHMHGGRGADVLLGGTENDWLYGDGEGDILRGGTSEDRLFGGAGNDQLFGEGGFDRLEAGSGDDYLSGGRQADNLFGGDGSDQLYGGDGLDRLFGDGDNDLLWGEGTGDGLFGGTGEDTLYGGTGGDRFFGGQGNDAIYGGSGDDTVYGSAGFDTLYGGAGDDWLMGNFNADTFVFREGFGNDTLVDFDSLNPLEQIDLSGIAAITDFQDLRDNHLTDLGTDTLLHDGAGNTILLSGVSISDLDNGDFLF